MGHFEVVDFVGAKIARFDTSPQSYSRNARLVSRAGSDDFMFDFQLAGRSWMLQGANEGAVSPGCGVLYDARRPFEDLLDGHSGKGAEVLIVTVPAAPLVEACPGAERMCAIPIPLASAVGRSIAWLLRSAICRGDEAEGRRLRESDIVTYLAAMLRHAMSGSLAISRTNLFMLVDVHIGQTLGKSQSPGALAALFGTSERSLYRLFSDRGTTFERHLLRRRVERFRELLSQGRYSHASIARLALECGFADAAHASRTFKACFRVTPREYRAGALPNVRARDRCSGVEAGDE